MKLLLLLCVAFSFSSDIFSQTQNALLSTDSDTLSQKVFHLGTITVTADNDGGERDRIVKKEFDQFNRFGTSHILNTLPSITLTASGQRNESMITLRGFDLRAVPVYMDGIPVYVPYDGYVDLNRFTTFDLSAIDVSKGFSSLIYGPNSLGGTINLISLYPANKLDINSSLGIINTNGYRGNINIGSNQGSFFVQAGYSYIQRNSFRLSSEFSPTLREDGGERDNSYRKDQKLSMKIGFTPNKNNEYVLGFILQQGNKGNPVYVGTDTSNPLIKKPRYWQWPQWDKTSFYFLSKTKFDNGNYFFGRFYYDVFNNKLNSFDDSAYSTQKKPSSFQTQYNDYSYGGNIEYGAVSVENHELKLSAQVKSDVHRENNINEPMKHFNDFTIYAAVEDKYKISSDLSVVPGVSWSGRKNILAEDYNSTTKEMSNFQESGLSNAINAQLGVFYHYAENNSSSFTFSRKTRFATIKDRYSYRMGTAIPNPSLKPETSINIDFNQQGKILEDMSFKASVYYSYLNDAIISASNVQPGKSQMQNTGSAQFYGAEASLLYSTLSNLLISLNLSAIKRDNLSNPNILFTDVPNYKLFSYIQYKPTDKLSTNLDFEYNSFRYSTSYGVIAPSFFIMDFIVSVQIEEYINLDAGVKNILDKNYMLAEGYPEEGRNFFVTLHFAIQK